MEITCGTLNYISTVPTIFYTIYINNTRDYDYELAEMLNITTQQYQSILKQCGAFKHNLYNSLLFLNKENAEAAVIALKLIYNK